jgi:hypothetical protein
MEETFAQIAGAAQHSIADVNVSISSGGSIVGQGVTASGGALQVCGGNLDKILQSFGGIQGGDTSFGGKSLSLLNHVGVLGGKIAGTVNANLNDVNNEIEELNNISDEADQQNNASVKEQANAAIAKLNDRASNLKTAGAELSALGGEIESAKNAVKVLGAQGGLGPAAAAMSLGFTGLNKLGKVASNVSHALNDAHHVSHNLRQQLGAGVNVDGGDEDLNVEGGALNTNGLAERLVAHRKAIQKLVNEFIQAFGTDLNKMVSSVNGMAADLGKRIDYDEKTQVFLETFERVREFLEKDDRAKMYQYLLELDHSMRIDSKEMKERFVSLMRDLSSRAEAMDGTASTKEFASACKSVVSTINQYSDKMKSFRDDLEKSGGSTETMNELFSVDASRINISGLLNPLDNLATAVKKVEFYRNISVFRSNLTKTSKEIELYSKDYAKSVGKAIGEAITKIQTEYTEIINSISDNKTGMGLEIDMYNESQSNDAKISKEKLKLIYKWQCDARVGLYKTVEAIDMYLLHFTETVTKNPDAVADLQKLLTATSIIAKWYDNKAGDNLIRVFEMLATDAAGAFVQDSVLDASNFVTTSYAGHAATPSTDLTERLSGDRANKLYERCRRAVEGVVVLKNIISYFITISEKYGSFKGERNIYMSPSNIYKNLVNYIWVSALDTNTAGFDVMTDSNELKRVINYEDTKVGIAKVSTIDPETLGINFNRHSIDKLRLLKCHNDVLRLRDFVSTLDAESFPRLKQFILATFARLGKTPYIYRMVEFGVFDITTMSKSQLTGFLQFLRSRAGAPGANPRFQITGITNAGAAVPAVDINSGTLDATIDATANQIEAMNSNGRKAIRISVYLQGAVLVNNAIVPLHIFNAFTDFNSIVSGYSYSNLLVNNTFNPRGLPIGFLAGLFQGLTGANAVSTQIGYTKRAVIALEYLVLEMIKEFKQANSNSVFAIDDTYFILTIKAIAGKVMAVTGINSIYKNPNAAHNSITQSPTRLIMGGAEGDIDIIDDAVELYVRLPLLVEFYRHIFDDGNKKFKDLSETNNLDYEQVSLVPEIGNVWSGLLINIFDKSKHIESGLYTQDNMRTIVSEINSIYKHFKSAVPADELIRHITSELVAEINRRYGVIKRQELMDYFKVLNATKENTVALEESNYTNNDFDILNEAMEFEEKAPSDAYVQKLQDMVKDNTVSREVKINKLTDYAILKNFREKLNTALTNMNNAVGPTSLRERIRFLKRNIQSKSSRQEKYDMIIKAIEESDSLNQSSNDIFMCFHEFVIMPLRTLHQMHNALKSFILNMYTLILSAQASGINANYELLEPFMNDKMKPFILEAEQLNVLFDTPNSHLNIRASNLLNVNLLQNNNTDFANVAANADDIQQMMIHLLIQFSTNAGGLVKLNITTTKRITIDLSEFQNVCEYLVANVKYMVDKFTGLIPTALLDAATSRDPTIKGIYYLEESLLMKMFNKQNHSESKRDVMCLDNLYKTMPVVSAVIFNRAMGAQNLLTNLIMHNTAPATITSQAAMPFIRDIFMQYRKADGMFIDNTAQTIHLSNLLFNPRSDASLRPDSQDRYGLIQEFNIIVSQYINGLYDAQSKKIYTKAFYTFASSALMDAMNGQSIKDFHLGGAVAPGIGFDCPRNQTILSSTLAYAIKVLTNRVNPVTSVKIHELATIQEISPHMMEKYRMLIPMYIRICNAFIARCKHYRKIIGYMTTDNGVAPNNTLILGAPRHDNLNTQVKENTQDTPIAFTPIYESMNGVNYNVIKDKSTLFIDEIVNATTSLLQDMETVQKELLETDTTVTLYFDVKKDFTKNYIASNKDIPFAPLSILAMAYPNRTTIRGANDNVIPIYNARQIAGSKFIYGLRTMLVDNFKISSAKVPYLKKLITDFNGYATSGNNIAETKFNDVLKYVGMANNFIYDFRFYNGLAISHMDALKNFPPTNQQLTTFQETVDSAQSMGLVESVNLVDSTNKIAEYVKTYGVNPANAIANQPFNNPANPRDRVILVNILDLKIMPLNVHSLMREIPLANLYNYAMTFDAVIDQLAADNVIEGMFQDLLKTPYVNVEYIQHPTNRAALPFITVNGARFDIDPIMNNSNLRFIADTIFTKMALPLNYTALTARLNTKLTRNLMFLTLVQYAIKKKVKREIDFINTRVVSNVAAVSDTITNARTDLGVVDDNLFEF